MKAIVKHSMLVALALSLVAGTSGFRAQAQGGADLLKQLQPNPEMLKKGDELFKANCAMCHGAKGDGSGQPALKPRNFHAKVGWKNGQAFASMFKTLEEGLPGTPMSSFSQLAPKDRVALIHHIRSLEPSNFPPITAQDAETLQKNYKLGDTINKAAAKAIPVDKAVELLIKEAEPQNAQIKAAVEKLMAAHDKGAQLVLDSTSNPERAFSMLVNAGNSWKGSVQDFSRIVLSNADTDGFRSETGAYSSAQWLELQNALKKLL